MIGFMVLLTLESLWMLWRKLWSHENIPNICTISFVGIDSRQLLSSDILVGREPMLKFIRNIL